MQTISGLGKVDRERLAAIIRGTKGTISVAESAEILKVSSINAAKMLSRWSNKGWLSRVRRGLYISVPLESPMADIPLDDPWIIAERLYTPCYIGGWSAAEYWDLTEQIFRTVVVMTTQKPRVRNPNFKGTSFMLRTVQEKAMFGLKPVWRGQVKISVSDPTRTILDMLNDPRFGGGIRSTADMFLNYLKSQSGGATTKWAAAQSVNKNCAKKTQFHRFAVQSKNINLLIEYAKRLGNGAVFKRLGFLLERFAPDEKDAMVECKSQLTKGNVKLDPVLKANKLITRWRMWVPENWIKERSFDRS